MTEGNTFEELVHEAFIAPLRSVLIIDDQYPTWEEIFNSKITANEHSEKITKTSSEKDWQQPNTAAEILTLIKEFRTQNPGFIIDIHDGVSGNASEKIDGNETPRELANHLHQSDLLVLDYNLEGAESGTGGKSARKILSSVLKNQHFNLMIIHTSDPLDDVMHQCIRSLLSACSTKYDENTSKKIEELEKLILEKEDSGEFYRTEIDQKIDVGTYIQMRHPNNGLPKELGNFIRGKGPFSDLHAWAQELSLDRSQMKTFFFWAIKEFEKKQKAEFTTNPPEGLSWKISDTCKWLRTSQDFVCFVEKGTKSLLSEVQNALVDWKPTPSRLLSAKYRHEISRAGAGAEDTTLQKKHAFAKFYQTIREPGAPSLPKKQIELLRAYRLKNHVSRQSEMLSFLVEDNVADFGQRIYQADEASQFTFHEHYGVNLECDEDKKLAISQYNHYVSCLPAQKKGTEDDWHEQLDSGHIFKLDGAWWVCATPACDLQPGQNTIAFKNGGDTSLRPFTAMKLHPISDPHKLSSQHINSGSYCYVEHEGKILALGVKSLTEDSSEPAVQKVSWRTFIARDGGVIKKGTLSVLEIQLELDDMQIKSNHKDAEVVAKLRYEYALNYIQRIGTSVSRIGLGYLGS